MKKTLAISAITLALTGMGASSSFASSVNVSVTPEKFSQSKAVKAATPLKQELTLKNGEATTKTFEHTKNANVRISITNKSTGGVHWYLKDSKGNVIMDERMAKGGFYKNEFYLSKGKYKIRVVSDNNGTGKIEVGARTLE
ncbi:hypothetical protein CN630_17830 [Bacillus wiedmannii]|uniref:hypothetical protein n=1 Tax=Bacillus wiedmannii TaxID=1890302 RepID=UPI000BF753C4|nr:hypothetical protein [Bacillus wiedmannii]PEN45656.1 hypothetical protein CN630_17830 [Bacillus wiedmannii]